jgi:hypothetical protein
MERWRMAQTETAGSVEAVEEAMQAAPKRDGRSESLAALVAPGSVCVFESPVESREA